jgi:hypothetical protein
VKDAGLLETDDKDAATSAGRKAFQRAKATLLADGFKEKGGMIWRTTPPPSRSAAAS